MFTAMKRHLFTGKLLLVMPTGIYQVLGKSLEYVYLLGISPVYEYCCRAAGRAMPRSRAKVKNKWESRLGGPK